MHACMHACMHTDRHTNIQTSIQTHTHRETGRQAGRRAGRRAGRQASKQAHTHRDRQMDRHTYIHNHSIITHIIIHTNCRYHFCKNHHLAKVQTVWITVCGFHFIGLKTDRPCILVFGCSHKVNTSLQVCFWQVVSVSNLVVQWVHYVQFLR